LTYLALSLSLEASNYVSFSHQRMYAKDQISLCSDRPLDRDSANPVKLLKQSRHHTSKILRLLPFSNALLEQIGSCAQIVSIDALVKAMNLRGCSVPLRRVLNQLC
jgi:hypothetical protein